MEIQILMALKQKRLVLGLYLDESIEHFKTIVLHKDSAKKLDQAA